MPVSEMEALPEPETHMLLEGEAVMQAVDTGLAVTENVAVVLTDSETDEQ